MAPPAVKFCFLPQLVILFILRNFFVFSKSAYPIGAEVFAFVLGVLPLRILS